MKGPISIAALVILCHGVTAQKIVEIQTATTDISGAGVSGGGEVGIEIINTEFKECNIDQLDNSHRDDLEPGIDGR